MDRADQWSGRLNDRICRSNWSIDPRLIVNCYRFLFSWATRTKGYPFIEINELYILLEVAKHFFTCSGNSFAGILSFEHIGQKR